MENISKSVTLENVWKVFQDPQSGKDITAVEQADFVIAPGELVTLLGPSGCGKTTTLRMIAGFELPTRGRVLIGSEDITYLPPNRRDTAMVFQSYGLFPHMNVFDNVAYGLRLRKMPEKEISEKVMRFLGMVGLDTLAKRPLPAFREVSSSGSPWPGPSSLSRRSSCWTNPCRTWTPCSGSRCGWRSAASRNPSASPPPT